jgi:hypothetical protein
MAVPTAAIPIIIATAMYKSPKFSIDFHLCV